MKRFVTKTMIEGKHGNEDEASPSPDQRDRQKRVDTGLGLRRDRELKESDYKVSISPGKNGRRQNAKTFQVKPTEINHFTGKRKSMSPDRNAPRNPSMGPNQGLKSPSANDGPELKVQVGERTAVFKYGDKEDEPRLIDKYIDYFQKKDSKSPDKRRLERSKSQISNNLNEIKSPKNVKNDFQFGN